MQPRGLEYKDISNKCGFYLMSAKPEKNLNLLPVDVKTAYVFYDDDLYFIDKDAETKCVYVKLDATRKKKLKADLQLANIEPLKKEEKCRALIPELSSEQLENISMTTGHYPSWLHRIILLNRKATELQQQSWEFEAKFRELEKRIAKLEESCTKKFTPKDLEELYPAEYKKTPARPTDYKEVKLKELRKRLELLGAGENKEALKSASEEISLIASQLNTDAPAYLDALKKYQDLDKELSDFSKNELTQDNVRTKVRSDINKLPLNLRIAAISIMPGATSMGALMDLLRHLKQLYEQEMHKAFVAITEKKLKKETFEENFKEYFKEELKEYFKKVAKRPTHEMANIKDEIERIISEFWKKFEIRNADRLNECNAYLRTIIYLSCTLETFRFTDKVQRLDIASAVSGKIGSLFGGEDIAGEFLDKLTVTQIENSFAMMPHASGLMTAIPNTERLWLEVAIWLRGLHQRSYDQISPFFKDNGVVKAAVVQHCGDDDDRNFFKFKGMVKWLLAQYHESHYQTLLLLLPPEVCNDLLPLLPPAFVGQYKKKNNLEPVQQEVVVASVEVTTDKKEGVDKKDKDEKNEGVPKEDKKVEPEKKTANFGTVVNLFQPVKLPARRFLTFEDLDAISQAKDIHKYAKFNSLLIGGALTDEQNLDIAGLKERIVRIFSNYKDSYFNKYYVPTFLKARRHITEVTDAHSTVTDLSSSPRDYILALYSVWNAASSDESDDIGPKAKEVLDACFDLLYTSLKPKVANTAV